MLPIVLERDGIRIRLTAFGAGIMSIEVPDRNGRMADVVLGFDTPEDYVGNGSYLGGVLGRFTNRIRDGRFALDGKTYQLAASPSGLHIHGGDKGFDQFLWDVEPTDADQPNRVRFARVSPDGEEGYPGTLHVSVTYTLADDHSLFIDYAATTDAPTVVNLSQHLYFNLAGHDAGSVLDHRAQIFASRFTPVDAAMIPTGEIRDLTGSPLDFRQPTVIGARIGADDEQLRLGNGYDHNYVIDVGMADLPCAARFVDPSSGRAMTVYTTEPGMQFYTANGLSVARGKGGAAYGPRSAFCMETQHFPDSPNVPSFPSTTLRPGNTYRSRTVFQFGCEP